MIIIRHGNERGHFDHGWLRTWHSFSFADYHDPKHTHFRTLRVLNEDFIGPSRGFGMHQHNDMEILTMVLAGELTHQDSLGNTSTIRPGELQRMTAGSGVLHSEFNHSQTTDVHLLQIWIFPDKKNLDPGYEQKTFADDEKHNQLRLVASRNGRDGSLTIHQDANVYATLLDPGAELHHPIAEGRGAWLQVATGELEVGGQKLFAGDGATVTADAQLSLKASGSEPAQFLLFDLA